ncbi:hypothetical protein Tco_0569639 [Tanacetum coccineum]
MGTKVTSSSGSVLEEPEIQKLQMQAKNLKENSLNKLNALKTTIQHLSSSNHSMYYEFREAFHRLFDANEGLFSHEQELKMTLKKLSEDSCRFNQCQGSRGSNLVYKKNSGDETSSRIVSDEEIEKKELEAHYGFMAKIQEVLPAESSSIDTPLEQVQNHDESKCAGNMKDDI